MPPKARNATRPSIYLDTSVLSYAFDGGAGAATAEKRALREAIVECAGTSDLCLSTAHVMEVARIPDERVCLAFAEWLETLPAVWIRNLHHVEADEATHWLARATGCSRVPAFGPFAASMVGVFEETMDPATRAALNANPTIRAWVEGERRRGAHRELAYARELRMTVRADRARADRDGIPLAARLEILDRNLEEGLRTVATKADSILRGVDADYAARVASSSEAANALVLLYGHDSQCLPLFRVSNAFMRSFTEVIARRAPGSQADRALDSSVHDYIHAAVPAAYCGLFNCDELTATFVRDARTALGRTDPIYFSSATGGLPAITNRLRAASTAPEGEFP